MKLRLILINGPAAVALSVFSLGAAQAQTTYPLGGGTITYSGLAPTYIAPTSGNGGGYDIEATAPSVIVNGVNVGATAPTYSYFLMERSTDAGSLAVTFQGAPSSFTGTGNGDGLDVYHTGPNATGDILLDTSQVSGNVFTGGVGGLNGYGIDVEGDALSSNVTIITGADTISGPSSGLNIYAAGTLSLNTAANISGGYSGVSGIGNSTSVVLTGAASISGNDGMDLISGNATGTITVGQNSSITGLGNIPGANNGNPFLSGNGYGISSEGGQTIMNTGIIKGVDAGIYLNNYTDYECNNSICNFTNSTGPSSITNGGTIQGVTASVQFVGPGANMLTLETGSTLIGNAIGSTDPDATNALVLQGQGMANNNFVNFNTLNVNATGIWKLNGISTISNTTINNGNLQVGDATHQSAQLDSNITIEANGTLSGHGTVGGAPINSLNPQIQNNGGTISPGGSIGTLAILADYQQTGGEIIFEIDPNGAGGFMESNLLFDPTNALSINDANIVFDFQDGADPLTFFDSGLFDLDSFFKSTTGDPFSDDFSLSNLFVTDSFDAIASNYDVTNFAFSPTNGATALSETSVPEPPSLAMLLAGLGLIGGAMYFGRKKFRQG